MEHRIKYFDYLLTFIMKKEFGFFEVNANESMAWNKVIAYPNIGFNTNRSDAITLGQQEMNNEDWFMSLNTCQISQPLRHAVTCLFLMLGGMFLGNTSSHDPQILTNYKDHLQTESEDMEMALDRQTHLEPVLNAQKNTNKRRGKQDTVSNTDIVKKIGAKSAKSPFKTLEDQFYIMTPEQWNVYNCENKKQIIESPPGSGKTLLIKYKVLDILQNDQEGHKIIIIAGELMGKQYNSFYKNMQFQCFYFEVTDKNMNGLNEDEENSLRARIVGNSVIIIALAEYPNIETTVLPYLLYCIDCAVDDNRLCSLFWDDCGAAGTAFSDSIRLVSEQLLPMVGRLLYCWIAADRAQMPDGNYAKLIRQLLETRLFTHNKILTILRCNGEIAHNFIGACRPLLDGDGSYVVRVGHCQPAECAVVRLTVTPAQLHSVLHHNIQYLRARYTDKHYAILNCSYECIDIPQEISTIIPVYGARVSSLEWSGVILITNEGDMQRLGPLVVQLLSRAKCVLIIITVE